MCTVEGAGGGVTEGFIGQHLHRSGQTWRPEWIKAGGRPSWSGPCRKTDPGAFESREAGRGVGCQGLGIFQVPTELRAQAASWGSAGRSQPGSSAAHLEWKGSARSDTPMFLWNAPTFTLNACPPPGLLTRSQPAQSEIEACASQAPRPPEFLTKSRQLLGSSSTSFPPLPAGPRERLWVPRHRGKAGS